MDGLNTLMICGNMKSELPILIPIQQCLLTLSELHFMKNTVIGVLRVY